jgi:small multidrug resistance family-3 protein
MRSLALFVLAALLEIGGCFAFWAWLRQGASAAFAAAGVLSLVAFAVVLTRSDAVFAGRAYAAYGGVYIAASLMWLWLVEGQAPTRTDLMGAAIAVIGAAVIVGFAKSDL